MFTFDQELAPLWRNIDRSGNPPLLTDVFVWEPALNRIVACHLKADTLGREEKFLWVDGYNFSQWVKGEDCWVERENVPKEFDSLMRANHGRVAVKNTWHCFPLELRTTKWTI